MPVENWSPEYYIKRGWDAVQFAQDVRSVIRKKHPKGHRQREADLEIAQERVQEAMTPIRSRLCQMQYLKGTPAHEKEYKRLRKVSEALQSERRKLWKMRQNPRKDPHK